LLAKGYFGQPETPLEMPRALELNSAANT
jgi:hypothetical protein